MALWECAECTTKYSVGAPKCPECGSTMRVNEATQPPEEDQDMAKITVHGGPSADGFEVNPDSGELTPVEEEGGEDVSAGNSSSTSSEKESTSPEQSETQSPSPVRTTGSRSKKAATAKASSVPSTDGDQAADTSAADSK